MANVNKVKVNNTIYDIEDTVARSSGVTMSSRADGSVSLSSASAGTSVNVPSLTNFGDPSELDNDVVTEINDLKSQIAQSSGLTSDVKEALLQIARKVAYIDADGQDYYDALLDALYPPANLVSISAVYTQTGAVYDTDSLDSLKSNLVVTAHYDDLTTENVTTYALSGTLTVGTSVITVAYGGKTTTFNVTVTEREFDNYGLYTPQSVVTGWGIGDDGSLVQSSGSAYIEDYISLNGISQPFEVQTSNTNWRITLYDSNKNFVRQIHYNSNTGGTSYGGHELVTLASTEKFMRLSYFNGTSTFYILKVEQLPMAIGAINATTGLDEVNDHRIRSDFIEASGTMTFAGNPFSAAWNFGGYAFRCYDSSKTFVGSLLNNGGLFKTDITNQSLPSNTAYVRIFMNHPQGADYTFATGWSSEVTKAITINGTNYVLTEAS